MPSIWKIIVNQYIYICRSNIHPLYKCTLPWYCRSFDRTSLLVICFLYIFITSLSTFYKSAYLIYFFANSICDKKINFCRTWNIQIYTNTCNMFPIYIYNQYIYFLQIYYLFSTNVHILSTFLRTVYAYKKTSFCKTWNIQIHVKCFLYIYVTSISTFYKSAYSIYSFANIICDKKTSFCRTWNIQIHIICFLYISVTSIYTFYQSAYPSTFLRTAYVTRESTFVEPGIYKYLQIHVICFLDTIYL